MAQKLIQERQVNLSLNDLQDTNVPTPLAGHILTYNENVQQWIAGTGGTSSVTPYYALVKRDGTISLGSNSWQEVGSFTTTFQTGGWTLTDSGKRLGIPKTGYAQFTARCGVGVAGEIPTVVLEIRYNGNSIWPQTNISYSSEYTFWAYTGSYTPGEDDILQVNTGWVPVTSGNYVTVFVRNLASTPVGTALQINMSAKLIEM